MALFQKNRGLWYTNMSLKQDQSQQNSSSIVDRSFTLFWDGQTKIQMINDFELSDFFAPFQLGRITTKNYDLLHETIYIGYTLPLLAFVGLLSSKRGARWLLPIAVGFFLVSN